MFRHATHAQPFIRILHAFECDDQNGMIEFDGYYYVNDGSEDFESYSVLLPIEEEIIVTHRLDTPPRVWRGQEPSFFKDKNGERPLVDMEYAEHRLDRHFYKIRIERREKLYNTDVTSTIEGEHGEEMRVCFFPTDRQRIYFRVLEAQVECGTPYKISRQLGPPVEIDVSCTGTHH